MRLIQSSIIETIINEALRRPDQKVAKALRGPHMVAISSGSNTGLSSVPLGAAKSGQAFPGVGDSVHGLATRLCCQGTIDASWGLAAVNLLLNTRMSGPGTKVQELISTLGKGKNVAIVGHFPFVEKMGWEFKAFWVLELIPRQMDSPECMKEEILPKADLIAITATTLLNNSLADILNLTRKHAVRIMLGPSTPLTPVLFELGMDYLGGTLVLDPQKALAGISKGLPFRKLDGVSFTLMHKQ